ncbi:LysR family transcriptional regulator [Methylomonas sp. MgM2]
MGYLLYLIAITQRYDFALAVAERHVSQPTLGTQVNMLEGRLTVMIFERQNKSL